MEVEVKPVRYINENEYEEASKRRNTPRQKEYSRLSKVRIDPRKRRTVKEDRSIAMDYLSLIQTVERKRRFAEISNEIRMQNNSEHPEPSYSRQEFNSMKFLEKKGIPGKLVKEDSKYGHAGSETDEIHGNRTSEYDLTNPIVPSHKRPKPWDHELEEVLMQKVNFEDARRERDALRTNSTSE